MNKLKACGIEDTREMVAWMWDSRVAAIGTDCPAVEQWPWDFRNEGALHYRTLSLLGLPLGEQFVLDDLAADCHQDRQYEFMLVSCPLNVEGGIASPPNAVVIDNNDVAGYPVFMYLQQVEGEALFCDQDAPGAIAVWDQGAAAFQEAGDPYGEFQLLMTSSAAAFFSDDPRLEGYARRALTMAESREAESSMAAALFALGNAHSRAGRPDEAIRCYRESLRRWQPGTYVGGISFAVEAMAWIVCATTPGALGARLLGASAAVWRRSGMSVDQLPFYFEQDRQAQEMVRAAIGPERFEAAFAESHSKSPSTTVAMPSDEYGP